MRHITTLVQTLLRELRWHRQAEEVIIEKLDELHDITSELVQTTSELQASSAEQKSAFDRQVEILRADMALIDRRKGAA